MTGADLDVLTLGMMMGEVAPPRAGAGFGDGRGLVLFPSGSMTIFALALARLGSRVGLLSRVGDDDLGRWMRERVEDAGIDTEGVASVAGQLTPLALASVDAMGNKSFSYYRFAGHQRSPGDAARRGCAGRRIAASAGLRFWRGQPALTAHARGDPAPRATRPGSGIGSLLHPELPRLGLERWARRGG